jgi:hypothetical protein
LKKNLELNTLCHPISINRRCSSVGKCADHVDDSEREREERVALKEKNINTGAEFLSIAKQRYQE